MVCIQQFQGFNRRQKLLDTRSNTHKRKHKSYCYYKYLSCYMLLIDVVPMCRDGKLNTNNSRLPITHQNLTAPEFFWAGMSQSNNMCSDVTGKSIHAAMLQLKVYTKSIFENFSFTEVWHSNKNFFLTKGTMQGFKFSKRGFTRGNSLALVTPSIWSLRPKKYAQFWF